MFSPLPAPCPLLYAPCYLITLSARTSTFGGIVRPICFAVFRLMTSSNFVGCSTGRSAGLAPFKILSTYKAARLVGIGAVGPVGHHAAAGDKISPRVNCRQVIFYRQVGDPFLIRKGQCARNHGETAATRLNRLFERALEIVGAAYLHRMKLQTQFSCRQLAFFPVLRSVWILRIPQHRNAGELWEPFP